MPRGTTEDFLKARLGSAADHACGLCHEPTGVVFFKKRGNPKGPEYVGPRYIVNDSDARCEFCQFLEAWMHHEDINPKETGLKYAAAKIITRDPKSGVDTLVAFVPFSSEDEVEGSLADGTKFEWKHALKVRAEHDEGSNGMKLVEILRD